MFRYYGPNGSISRTSLSSKKASTFSEVLKPAGHTLQRNSGEQQEAPTTTKNAPQLTVNGLTPSCWTVTKDSTRMCTHH